MKRKIKVAVLMGGKSSEHKISLMSGREVVKNLDPKRYDVLPVIISSDGRSFQLNNRKYSFSQLSSIRQAQDDPELTEGSTINCQLFFIAMHGPYGEDGTIQGFLELVGVPYTGSGVLASALGMDKISSKKLFTQAGLKVPSYLLFKKGNQLKKVWQKFRLPIFVKPHNQGSSVGTTKVNKKNQLSKALTNAFNFSDLVLVEEFIDGTEITCPILGNNKPQALPQIEIAPKTEYFDYQAKYNERLCDEIVPARISKSLTKKAQEAALTAYRTLGCRGFGRVDMIAKDNNIYVLEVNTIPGLTPVSLFPKSAAYAGISYPKLLDKIINFALEKKLKTFSQKP